MTGRKSTAQIKAGSVDKNVIPGPTLFEVEYLRQMKEEWEIYLRSKNFSTIVAFELVFQGAGYEGSMKVTA
jgi:hypothetical protein